MKDQLFNSEKTRYLAGLFAAADAGFNAAEFEARVMARLPELELKARIAWIAEVLGEMLPEELPEAAPILLKALPAPLDPAKTDDDFGDFIFAPLGEMVVAKGLEAHPELSLDLLQEITRRFSMEWAIRPFLNRWPDLTLSRMKAWAESDNYHVRRLVSEGTRPRLPWGEAVGLGLQDALPLLDLLHADGTRYVTRSIANHLNDIAKKNPDLVLNQLRAWQEAARQRQTELDWMAAHALRGLVKAGNPDAMRMLGFDPDADVAAAVAISGDARIGGALEFSVTLEAPQRQPVLVDYVIHFQRPGGKVSPKVHKLKQAVIAGGALGLKKKHKLKGDATTFKLVPGLHRLEVQVNGRIRAAAEFELLA